MITTIGRIRPLEKARITRGHVIDERARRVGAATAFPTLQLVK
jgi:hypothetical protein